MTNAIDGPATVRRLANPAAQALADLASIFNDLQTVLRCCEHLVEQLAGRGDDVVIEGVWTTALISYARCFTGGNRGMGLTEKDVEATALPGEVLEWHKVLRRLRKHYADPGQNPRERFEVGAATGPDGKVSGIAITSTPQPPLDEVTVRQTGALAYRLSALVDERITEHQQRVLSAASAMSPEELGKLQLIDLGEPARD
ncbi:hypothetical protein [Amycolatopsis sp.]|uniref:hypothetical protein n=1 Tax=Amycolatopsis sp. TaxID=37632 RepID=UPI002BB47427|nr:hypothetical protein [Amycolatopsis sp.]HVV12160.1 hypothetical protein [Amycolatopsis sp.]